MDGTIIAIIIIILIFGGFLAVLLLHERAQERKQAMIRQIVSGPMPKPPKIPTTKPDQQLIDEQKMEYCTECPLGWKRTKDSDGDYFCQPPTNYKGSCKDAYFQGFNSSDIQNWINKCGVNWPKPCTTQKCTYCPQFFKKSTDKNNLQYCKPVKEYDGSCPGPAYFQGYTRNQLFDWAQNCQATWTNPCNQKTCTQCPKLWQPSGENHCKSLPIASGGCLGEAGFKNYSIDDKYRWAQKCSQSWEKPCP